ncbi:MAG: peptidase M16 [Betaproteobacteria bacterium RIFCSPLOWO2_12_FULL_62_58]|nr:MAG: peptidase M16 [Betaproteobacteria bacterium RIFCSPLOWO2_12_FULL_62_58]
MSAAAVAADAVEHTLANGLRVIVKPDRRAPVVVSMVWYKVGSVDEFNGTTGVAHLLEHMMFKGTKAVPGGEFSKIIAAAGGRDNAFTSKDYTGYFQMLHKSQLPLSFKLEADRMTNLVLTQVEFAKEIKVVMEERRWRTDDRARSMVYERLMATALAAHPYRNPVIGWMNDLENMRVEDARAFYERWYAPNNAVLVVVGDVAPQEVFGLAQQYFGAVNPKALPPRKPQEEPPQLGLKRLTVKAPAELPYVVMAYRVPVLRDPENDWEPYALEMLANVLDGNAAARLPRTLVRMERLANSAGASYDGIGRGPGLFYLDGVPTPGKTPLELEQGLRRELRRIADEGVTEDELKRIRSQAIAGQVYQRDSMFFQARQIGSVETAGLSHKILDLLLEKLKQVTAAQVQEVAKKYFSDEELTVAYLDPQPLAARKPAAPPPGLRHAQ